MSTEAKALTRGDACPACGGAFTAAPVPTAAQREAAARRENAVALPSHYDTATTDDRATLGALFVCGRCGYKTRFPEEAKPAAAA